MHQETDRLRQNPTFQVVAGDGRTALGSQPTLSRLENAIDWPAIGRLARTGVDWFCAYAYGPNEHPDTPILLRGDAGMATPGVEVKLEAEGVRYVLGIGTNKVFKRRGAGLVAKAQRRHERTSRPVSLRTSFWHRARRWHSAG